MFHHLMGLQILQQQNIVQSRILNSIPTTEIAGTTGLRQEKKNASDEQLNSYSQNSEQSILNFK